MLCNNDYPQAYIDECRQKVAGQVSAYDNLVAVTRGQSGAGEPKIEEAVSAFETEFFNNMVLVLEGMFVHRSRTIEKKDGNPANEVRMLARSLMEHGGVLGADSTIKYKPENTVLKYEIGD